MQMARIRVLIALTGLCLVALCQCRSLKSFAIPPIRGKNLIVVSFDGFRPDYINQQDTPNLHSYAHFDVTAPGMKSLFITKTFSNHHSIATGLYEPYHGVINNRFYDPATNTTFMKNDPSPVFWDQFNRNVPIYIANQWYERATRHSAVLQWPGSMTGYTDGTGQDVNARITATHLVDYKYENEVTTLINNMVNAMTDPQMPANLALLYFPEPDEQAHMYGPFSPQVKEMTRKVDQAVAYLHRMLATHGLADNTNVIYLSDHGMAEVTADRVFYMVDCLAKFPGLEFKMIGSSPVLSIMPISPPDVASTSPEPVDIVVRDALNQCASELFNGKFHVYRQQDIPDEFHYKGNPRILPLFLLADEGYDVWVDRSVTKPKGYPVWGNHGYNNSLPSMRPLFIATGPSFKKQYVHKTEFQNIDLFPLMLHLIGIPHDHFPSNGTFAKVAEMLV